MSRPPFNQDLPAQASNLAYPAGSDPWSSTVTKLDPGALLATGATPGRAPGAQFENFAQNRRDQFIAYLDQIDVHSYIRSPGPSAVAYNIPIAVERVAAFDTSHGRYWMVGGNNLGSPQVFSSFNGFDWIDESSHLPASPPNYTMVDLDPVNGFVVIGSDVSSTMAFRAISGTWFPFSLTTANAFAQNAAWLERDQATGINFLIGSSITIPFSGTFPAIFDLIETGGGTGTAITTLTVDTGTTTLAKGVMVWVITNPTNTTRLGIAQLTSPAAQFTTWSNTNLGANWEPVQGTTFPADPFTTPVAAAGGPGPIFMVTCSDGKVFTSTNGNWALASNNPTMKFKANCLAARGSIWLAVASLSVDATDRSFVFYSIDNGITWRRVAWPLDQGVAPLGVLTTPSRFHLTGAEAITGTGRIFNAQSMGTR